jgi:hypothetical protein
MPELMRSRFQRNLSEGIAIVPVEDGLRKEFTHIPRAQIIIKHIVCWLPNHEDASRPVCVKLISQQTKESLGKA